MADSDSEDDVPLIRRRNPTDSSNKHAAAPAAVNGSRPVSKPAAQAVSKVAAAAAAGVAAATTKSTAPAVVNPAVVPAAAPALKQADKPASTQTAKPGNNLGAAMVAKAAEKHSSTPAVKVAEKPAAAPAADKPAAKAAEKPIAQAPQKAAAAKPAVKPTPPPTAKVTPPPAAKPAAKPVAKPAAKPAMNGSAKRPARDSSGSSDSSDEDSSDDDASSSGNDSDKPLSQRRPPPKKVKASGGASAAKRKRDDDDPRPASTKRTRAGAEKSNEPGKSKNGEVMWKTLEHAGVMFPPDYEPHNVKMLYDGKPVELTPEQEEVATMFAVMKDSDYATKPVFIKNFWEGFREVLGKKHTIQDFNKCDFTPIFNYFAAQKEKKKEKTKEEKAQEKKDRDAAAAKFTVAKVDGRVEPVGNFRVEPPGLFRGRGEHPRMGKVKRRVYPRDIVINIGEGVPIPEHPYPGQTWKEVRHDHTVTWLAYWKDTISASSYKYVFLGATSSFKAESDLAKYERARKLKDLIEGIRKDYERDWEAKDVQRRQMGVALYFLDKLALRAGHEKDEDEADTVGCCTLKTENIELVPPSSIKFDFLGKDSIRYENTVEVDPKVYTNVEKFKKVDAHGKRKAPGDQLFETFDAGDLNKVLKNIMDGLSVKVFRTYNASITLDRLLVELETSTHGMDMLVDQKKADYDLANKEVAILCNHQKSVPKTHGGQMEKLQDKVVALTTELKELEEELRLALRGKAKDDAKRASNPDTLRSKIETKKKVLAKAKLAVTVKEDLKTVALGTSKINYMDPRITVAWCKRNEVPLEKVFNKSLLGKFNWAMDVEPDFRF